MNNGDLEFWRDAFQDLRQHVAVGVVLQLEMSEDASSLHVLVNLLPENRQVVAVMSFADVYDVTFPELNDLVLIGFVDGEPDGAHVMARFSSDEEPIPVLAQAGDSVKYARLGKKMYVGSDTKIGLARPDVDPLQPLVLGLVFKSMMSSLMAQIATLTAKVNDLSGGVSAIGGAVSTVTGLFAPTVYLNPVLGPIAMAAAGVSAAGGAATASTAGAGAVTVGSAVSALKASPVDDSLVLSDLAFTEKGS